MKFAAFFLFLSVSCALINGQINGSSPSSLKLVFALFEHGETTPVYQPYPNDPYINETWFPPGAASLTNKGKEQGYEVGRYLRERYNSFLGNLFYNDIVFSRTTFPVRSRNTMNLVQTSLFDPTGQNIWSTKYKVACAYQPIPYEYQPNENDPELTAILCPEFIRLFELSKSTTEYQEIYNRHLATLAKLVQPTGLPQPIMLRTVRQLYKNLKSQEYIGKTLPDWTQDVYPEELRKVVIDSYKIEQTNNQLRKIQAGFFFRYVISQINLLKNGNLPKGRKIYLFSGLDISIAHPLVALNIFEDVPKPASFVLFEVHENNQGELYLKLFSQNYETKNPKEIVIPACGPNCKISQLETILQDIIPGPNDYCKVPAC